MVRSPQMKASNEKRYFQLWFLEISIIWPNLFMSVSPRSCTFISLPALTRGSIFLCGRNIGRSSSFCIWSSCTRILYLYIYTNIWIFVYQYILNMIVLNEDLCSCIFCIFDANLGYPAPNQSVQKDIPKIRLLKISHDDTIWAVICFHLRISRAKDENLVGVLQ